MTNGKVSIAIDGEIATVASVTILDVLGRICHQFELEDVKTELDISDLKSGLYLIKLSNGDRDFSYKLLVE